jgi:hypothetical protein
MNRELLQQCLDLITALDKDGVICELGLILELRDALGVPDRLKMKAELAKPEQAHDHENELDRVYDLVDELYDKVHDLVDAILTNENPEVENLVRIKMTEEFRFWKRINE